MTVLGTTHFDGVCPMDRGRIRLLPLGMSEPCHGLKMPQTLDLKSFADIPISHLQFVDEMVLLSSTKDQGGGYSQLYLRRGSFKQGISPQRMETLLAGW